MRNTRIVVYVHNMRKGFNESNHSWLNYLANQCVSRNGYRRTCRALDHCKNALYHCQRLMQ